MATLKVHRIDPFSRAEDLKALFVRNERPDFPDWFDRAYPIAMRDGGSTWVSLDTDDRVVAHMSAFRSEFWFGDQVVGGSLLCNLMADKAHRSFFPVATLIKRAVSDLREEGAEFIYTNPINKASVAVMRAAGLNVIGEQNRFLLPTGDRRWYLDFATGVAGALRRRWYNGCEAVRVESADAADWTVREHCRVSRVSARRHAHLYLMRQGNTDGPPLIGFAIRDANGARVGAALVRAWKEREGYFDIVTLRCCELRYVTSAVVALGGAMRREGAMRLNASLLMNTPFASAITRAGFFVRNENWAIVANGYTERGRALVKDMASSDLEKIDVD